MHYTEYSVMIKIPPLPFITHHTPARNKQLRTLMTISAGQPSGFSSGPLPYSLTRMRVTLHEKGYV